MFEFTKEEFEQIVNKAMLNEELTKIFEMKIKDYSITKIALVYISNSFFAYKNCSKLNPIYSIYLMQFLLKLK